MKKKLLITFCLINIPFCVLISQILPHNLFSTGFAEPDSYSLVFTKERNKFHNTSGATPVSGTSIVKTELGNDVTYSYSNVIGGGTSTWHVLSASNSYFYNQDPLNGLYSIELSFKTDNKEFKIYWSSTLNFNEINCETFTSSSESNTICYFNGYNPNFVKVENLSGNNLNISNVFYKYSCTNQYYELTRSSEDELLGTVSGDSGVIKAGTDVSISATPSTGCKFEGWYCNSEKISSENPYLFTMPYNDLNYVAKFIPETYTLFLSSNDEIKGSVSGSGEYPYLSQVTAIASPNEGYEFDGWYNKLTKVSSALLYTFTMPYNDYSLTGKFINSKYSVTVSSNDLTKGTVSGSGDYLYLSSVTLKAIPVTGSHFVGWFDGDTLISSNPTYTFDMPHNDINYVGKFEYTYYSLTVTSEDEDKGTVRGSGNYIYQEEVEIKAIPSNGYTFFGWYIEDELLSRETIYNYTMPLEDTVIVAKFTKLYNLYIESDDESKGIVSYPSTFGEGLEVTIKAIPNEGYALNYWYNEDFEEVCYDPNYSFVMPSNDVILYANFVEGGHKVNVEYDNDKGKVFGDFNYLEGQTVSLQATSNGEFVFNGWYLDSEFNNLISKNIKYTFEMPDDDVELYARFWTLTEEKEEEWKIAHGLIPTFNCNKTKLTYGLYPQTHVNDLSLIQLLNELDDSYIDPNNGWYLYNDEYYAKVSANPYGSNYRFDNGTTIKSGVTYWFKCEPITWNILSNNNGEYYILSSVLLDAYCYYNSTSTRIIGGKTIHPNNYKYSDIRSWLNNDFYNSAFALGSSHIQTTNVDNSSSTTLSVDNPYACDNTLDKVFLPSYKDYINTSYGFSTSTLESNTRYCKTTDWARARGAYYTSRYLYNGFYWTRSPLSNYPGSITLRVDGGFDECYIDYPGCSVRPALSIKIA